MGSKPTPGTCFAAAKQVAAGRFRSDASACGSAFGAIPTPGTCFAAATQVAVGRFRPDASACGSAFGAILSPGTIHKGLRAASHRDRSTQQRRLSPFQAASQPPAAFSGAAIPAAVCR